MSLEGALAANRFGLGPKPGDISQASADPKAWLLGQLKVEESPAAFTGLQSTADLAADLLKLRQLRMAGDIQAIKTFNMQARNTYLEEMAARYRVGFETAQPFRERLIRFWSNHFTVSISKPAAARFVGGFEREAVRPHVTGRFADMVLAVERHPAMLFYLDNAASIGPDSFAGLRTGKGLNENLGREILELHTLGVDGGYTQDDVIALAKIITGWSVGWQMGAVAQRLTGAKIDASFGFYPMRHEPGSKTLLGRTYPEGYEGGIAALTDLAHHPATARHVAVKLATHFIADDPPEDSIRRLETAFRESGGELMKVYEVLLDDPVAWRPAPAKFRTPVEYVTAAMRIAASDAPVQLDESNVRTFIQTTRLMGEVPFGASSPKGWPDIETAWTGSDAVLKRVEWADAAAKRLGAQSDPVMLADEALGPLLSGDTRTAISRAASPAEGLGLLFVSPEFQRR